jgi:hypothetical protein
MKNEVWPLYLNVAMVGFAEKVPFEQRIEEFIVQLSAERTHQNVDSKEKDTKGKLLAILEDRREICELVLRK